MSFEKSLSISQLLLDIRNPRLPQVQDSQLAAIKTMGSTQADKIIALSAVTFARSVLPAPRLWPISELNPSPAPTTIISPKMTT